MSEKSSYPEERQPGSYRAIIERARKMGWPISIASHAGGGKMIWFVLDGERYPYRGAGKCFRKILSERTL